MGRNVGELSYNMEGSTQWHLQRHRNLPEKSAAEQPFPEGRSLVCEGTNHSISRTTSSKRLFRQGFMAWVAFERSLSPKISDLVKRTCPVADCELRLESESHMREHLKGCLHLEKGFYRCHEDEEIKRIGKCDTNGCRDLQQYKGLFSNAMHTLGRRLSPRGSRPHRFVQKISNKHSKSPHLFGVDPRIQFSGFDWEPSMDSDAVPEYTPFNPEWIPNHVVELSSGCEVRELPANHGFTEIYDATTYEFFGQPQHGPAELGIDDSTQISQFLAHGTYQPAELSTPIDPVYKDQNESTVQDDQVDGWERTPSNYNITPEDAFNLCYSNKDLFMNDGLTMDARIQGAAPTSNAMPPFGRTELVSAVENKHWHGRYPSTCDVSPMSTFTESDIDQGNSIFSMSPSSSAGTSFSAPDSVKPVQDSTPAPLLSFFGEPHRVCEEPMEDFEPFESANTLMNDLHQSLQSIEESAVVYQDPTEEIFQLSSSMPISANQIDTQILASSWTSDKSNRTSGQSSSSSSGSSWKTLHEEPHTKCQPQQKWQAEIPHQQLMSMPLHRIRRKPVASSPPEKYPPIQRLSISELSPDIDYSSKTATPSQSPGKQTSYQCEYCEQHFTDSSNLKRHIVDSCKKHPNYSPHKDRKTFKCNFNTCKSGFTRMYNLRHHQRTQGHMLSASTALLYRYPY